MVGLISIIITKDPLIASMQAQRPASIKSFKLATTEPLNKSTYKRSHVWPKLGINVGEEQFPDVRSKHNEMELSAKRTFASKMFPFWHVADKDKGINVNKVNKVEKKFIIKSKPYYKFSIIINKVKKK